MSVKWTDEQLKAILATDKAVVVSAAAGSGKTAVLIERTIRMLTDPYNPISADKLLAVTFTNDAASQMREKLSEALNKKIEQDPSNEWLATQQMKLPLAKISTINAFCLDLVKSNIQQFDISSGVRILDDTEYSVMRDKGINEVIDSFYSNHPDIMEHLDNAFGSSETNGVSYIVGELYKFSRSLPFKDIWFNMALSNLEPNEENIQRYKEFVFGNLNSELSLVLSQYSEAYEIAGKLKSFSKLQQVIYSDNDIIMMLKRLINEYDFDLLYNELINVKFARLNSKIDKGCEESYIEAAMVEKIKSLRENYKKSIKTMSELICYSEKQIILDLHESQKVFSELVMIVNELDKNLWEQKVDKNAVDFADVELMSIKLLCEQTENGYKKSQLAREISSSGEYKIILIDEFQDVNNLQDIIFKMISDTDDNEIIGKNMFIVGDVKQSIYGFRQSNPKIFIKARADANKECYTDKLCEIKLTKNFRSRKCVVDFVNFIFENIMSEKIGEVVYNEAEHLVEGAGYDEKLNDTELLVIDNSDIDDTEDTAVSEPYIVAKKIKSMIDSGYPVYEKNEYRKCRPDDFCILLRNKTHSKEYIEALKQFSLASDTEELTGYLRSREVSVLINMLKVIDNPMDDVALVCVLLSEIFMFTSDEIGIIKNKSISLCDKLYNAFLEASNFDSDFAKSIGEELSYKCTQAVLLIKKFRFYASSLNTEQLITKIYDSTDYFSCISVYDDSEQKRANLRLLIQYASSYEKSIGGGLSGFIYYINSIFKNGNDFKQAAAVKHLSDAIIIKTIHKSKGLEFPFIFLCGTNTKFTTQKKDLSKQILFNVEYGVGFKLYDKANYLTYTTLAYDAIKSANMDQMLSEEMRLLYVALTRAKEKLFITYMASDKNVSALEKIAAKISGLQGVTDEVVKSANSMQDWISMCLLVCEKYSFVRDLLSEQYAFDLKKFDGNINFDKCDEGIDVSCDIADDVMDEETVSIDNKIIENITRYLDFKYDSTYSDTPSKLSVSEVAKKDNPLGFVFQIPRLDDETGTLTAAEKGTAVHSFMELADYNNAAQDVNAEIKRLTSLGLLSGKQADAIDIDSIRAFFESSFYERIKNSNNVMREKQFLVTISDLNLDEEELLVYNNTDGMLQGIADCLFEESDGYVLVDYKTDNVKILDELTQNYSLQLKLYKAAFGLLFDKPIKSSYIYSFKLRQGIELMV